MGLESSISNSKIFIFNTDTVFTSNREAVFVSYYRDLNFFTLSLGKNYGSIAYNYENGVFTSYGSFMKDSSVEYSNFYVSLNTLGKLCVFFFEKDGKYDTILKGGKYIGLYTNLLWEKKGIEFTYGGKYGIDSKEPVFSFTLNSTTLGFSVLLNSTFEKGNYIFLSSLTHNVSLKKGIQVENSLNMFSNNIKIQSLLGSSRFKAGVFGEIDNNEDYFLKGFTFDLLNVQNYVSLLLNSQLGYKTYKDTFFNANTMHFEASGNVTFNIHGISIGATGAVILEKDSKNFYITSSIAKEF